MPISLEDAQQLYKSGNISEDTFNSIAPKPADNPQEQNVNYTGESSSDANKLLGLQPNQPVLADNNFNPGKLNPASIAFDMGKDIVGGVNDSGAYNRGQGYNLNIFENPNAANMEKKVIDQTDKSAGALETIGTETKNTVAPVATTAQSDIEEQNARIREFAAQAKTLTDNATSAQQRALDKLSNIYQQGKVDPQQYVKELGVDGKVMTGIGLVLSGMGSGLTGQPNMAMQVLQKNIDRNIDAQKQKIANDFQVVAQQLGIGSQALQTAQIKGAITNLASAMVNTGAAAAVEAAEKTVKAKTGVESAQLLKQALLQNAGKYTLDFDNIHKSTIQGNQSEQYKLLTGALNNFGRYGTWYQPDMADLSKTPYKNVIQSQSKTQTTPEKPMQQPVQTSAAQPKKQAGFLDQFIGTLGGMKQSEGMGE